MEFQIEGSAAVPIRGDVDVAEAGGPRPVVVALHGFKGFRRWGFWPHVGSSLARAGFAVVRYDASHNGVGPGGLEFDEQALFERNTWAREEEDVDRVLAALRSGSLPGAERMDLARVALLGHSRGGGLAIVRAARDPDVGAVVALAPIATVLRFPRAEIDAGRARGFLPILNTRTGETLRFGAEAVAELDLRRDLHDLAGTYASALATPLLVCHGTADTSVPQDEGRRLAAAAPNGRFEAFEGADHVLGARHPFGGTTPHLERFLQIAADFLRETLGP